MCRRRREAEVVKVSETMSFFQPEGSQELSRDQVNVDFLLPTGILVPLACRASQRLEDIKDTLWRRAKEFPLYGLLRWALPLSPQWVS